MCWHAQLYGLKTIKYLLQMGFTAVVCTVKPRINDRPPLFMTFSETFASYLEAYKYLETRTCLLYTSDAADER